MSKKQQDCLFKILRNGNRIVAQKQNTVAILDDGSEIDNPAAWADVVEHTARKFADADDIYRMVIKQTNPVKASLKLHMSVAGYYNWRRRIYTYGLAAACQAGVMQIYKKTTES